MLYDCFLYNGEADMLRLRLGVIGQIVDHIVLVEATTSFSGQSKSSVFNVQDPRWAALAHKFIHVVVTDTPDTGQYRWGREFFQRNAILRGLVRALPTDHVLIADVDEIPDPDQLQVRKLGGYRCQVSNYYLNCVEPVVWTGPVLLTLAQVFALTPQGVRNQRVSFPAVSPGGWHFTYVMSEAQILEKIHAFAHDEYDTPNGVKLILDSRRALKSFVSNLSCPPIAIATGYFPQFLKDHQAEYAHLIAPVG